MRDQRAESEESASKTKKGRQETHMRVCETLIEPASSSRISSQEVARCVSAAVVDRRGPTSRLEMRGEEAGSMRVSHTLMCVS